MFVLIHDKDNRQQANVLQANYKILVWIKLFILSLKIHLLVTFERPYCNGLHQMEGISGNSHFEVRQKLILPIFAERQYILSLFKKAANQISHAQIQTNDSPLYNKSMFEKEAQEDSLTLDNYFQITKRGSLQLKKQRKDSEHGRRQRKHSTQLSIFGWLNQAHTNQKSLILTLDKYLLLKVFGYLRLSELVAASQVCSYFLSCYRSLWNDKDFFCQLETDKLTTQELGRLIEKATRLDHIRQLKHIYSGKNINYCRQKIKIKVGEGSPNTGGMLEVFSVTPKTLRSGSTFILDSHVLEIVNSSFRSLKVVELVKCSLLKDWVCLSRCIELTRLTISFNENFKNEDLGMICKRCKNLEYLYLEECKRLDENIFEHIQYVEFLESFTLRNFKQSFLKLKKLENNQYLTHLDIEGSLIRDIEAFQIIRLKTITHLSIKNCIFLTDSFIDHLDFYLNETSLKTVNLEKVNFDQDKVDRLEHKLMKN